MPKHSIRLSKLLRSVALAHKCCREEILERNSVWIYGDGLFRFGFYTCIGKSTIGEDWERIECEDWERIEFLYVSRWWLLQFFCKQALQALMAFYV
jgi:hypothetical protein